MNNVLSLNGDDSFNPDSNFGIVINISYPGQFHCGLLYKDNGISNILHLAWHNTLEHTINTSVFSHFVSPFFKMHSSREMYLIQLCKYITNLRHRFVIPYALGYEGKTVFDESGIIQISDGEYGLTCATFVLSIFQSIEVPLIDYTSWPTPSDDDKEFQNKIVEYLERSKDAPYNVSSVHITNVLDEISKGVKRYKPQDVSMSITFETTPRNYVEISPKGQALSKRMEDEFIHRK